MAFSDPKVAVTFLTLVDDCSDIYTFILLYHVQSFPCKMCHTNKCAFIVLNKADISISSPFHAIPWLLSFKPGRASGTHTIL